MRFKIMLFIITSFICLVILELVVRKLGRYELYTEKNKICSFVSPFEVEDNSWYHKYDTHIIIKNVVPINELFLTNNEGCRDVDFNMDSTKKIILTIGDSFTESYITEIFMSFKIKKNIILNLSLII